MSRVELTQSRIRFIIVGALITALFILLGSNHNVHQPVLDKIHQWNGPEEAAQPPKNVPSSIPNSAAAKVIPHPDPITTVIDATELMPLAEAETFCKYRRFKPYPHRQRKRKIFDLMMVNDELEWLEIRMGQMSPYVDYFVVMEAEISFTDQKKPLHVKNNMDRFAKYKDKIIRHTLKTEGVEFKSTWERETYSRNAMVKQVLPFLEGAKKPEADDVIIIADVDELLRPETLSTMRNCEIPDALTLNSRMYYYSFQWLNRINGEWPHPQAMLWKGPDETREADHLRSAAGSWDKIFNAGWHCSYCFGNLKDMINKVQSFSHSEFNKPEFKDPKKILDRVRFGMDFFDRDDSHFDRYDNNPDIPDFLKANKDKYAFTMDRDPPNGNFKDAMALLGPLA